MFGLVQNLSFIPIFIPIDRKNTRNYKKIREETKNIKNRKSLYLKGFEKI